MTTEHVVRDHHRSDSSPGNSGGIIASSVLRLLGQPPPDRRGDVWRVDCVRRGKTVARRSELDTWLLCGAEKRP